MQRDDHGQVEGDHPLVAGDQAALRTRLARGLPGDDLPGRRSAAIPGGPLPPPGQQYLGDATDVPASKAGSVAHFEGEVLAGNVRRFLAGKPLTASFDGHTNCFIETGRGQALLIDFNYDTEPLTGHYPGRLGLPLLRPSRLNHLGKLALQPLYWHGLLPGRDIPGISPAMPARGKNLLAAGR